MGGRGQSVSVDKRYHVRKAGEEYGSVLVRGEQDFSGVSKKTAEFNKFRFAGLDVSDASNKYWNISSSSPKGDNLIVQVGDTHYRF